MTPTPPALKWLTDKRARTAGKLHQSRHVLADIQEQSAKLLVALSVKQTLVEKLTADLAALDRTVQVYDSALDGSSITPVNAWKGTYGHRGALKQFVAQTLKQQSPDWVPVNHLGLLAIKHFSLSFDTKLQQVLWQKRSVRTSLRSLESDGVAERVAGIRTIGQWRWKQQRAPTLAELRACSQRTQPAEAIQ